MRHHPVGVNHYHPFSALDGAGHKAIRGIVRANLDVVSVYMISGLVRRDESIFVPAIMPP